ncbi:CHAT domain-containing protein [Rhodobacteraceae bacterium CCMM004]|nr:CHAT domain-containing protein [Rhodobacteraceae bacterium CCMM004]
MLRLVALCLIVLATPLGAQSYPEPADLTPAERAALRAEIRDRVFLTAQTAQTTAAGRALAQAAVRAAAGGGALAALLRSRQDGADRLDRLVADLAVAGQGSGANAEAEVRRLEREVRDQRAALAQMDARLTDEFPDFRELTDPQPLTVDEVQAALDPDEALLLTLTDDEFTYLWAVSKTAADWTRAPLPDSDVNDRIRSLRAQLSGDDGTRAGVAINAPRRRGQGFDRGTAHGLYAQVFQPLEHVFRDAAHVIAVVDGPWTSLPLSVLITDPPAGDDADPEALRQTGWLIKRHALTTLPSVSALKVLRRARDAAPADPAARRPFVGFGDPVLGYRLAALDGSEVPVPDDAVVTRGVYEDVREVADLAPLPNTARELRRLAATMGADEGALYLGPGATETAVKEADLGGVDVIAFATHGLLADGLPGLSEPALVFTPPAAPTTEDDALLTASEAAQLKLSARLVILSACDTAGSDGTPGAEGLSGLARAFIYAGARAILVSHWPVDDFAASVLTTGMLDRMTGDDPRRRAEALQASMLDLLQDRSEDRFAHPRLWAPFVVVGEGGDDRAR